LTYLKFFIINILKRKLGELIGLRVLAFGARRPSEPVWIIPAKGSGKRWESRDTFIGITAFLF
jgi:hypothetical protein